MIRLTDLSSRNPAQSKRYVQAIQNVMRHGAYIQGKEVDIFEKQFASYVGTRHCIGVASGTDALYAALTALHIGTGDEVIIPAFTFVSTAFAVLAAGATPVLVDVDPVTLTLNPTLLSRAYTTRTRAIIPVHLYGLMADVLAIRAFAQTHRLFVVEDAAQAIGSTHKGRMAGSMGDIGCFSFYPSKNLGGMGDNGAVVTNSSTYARYIRIFCNLGQNKKYRHEIVGINSRMDTIQASVLSQKLLTLNRANTKRQHLANLYTKLLHDLPIQCPTIPKGYQSNYHLYVIRTKHRTALRERLHDKGIETGIHYPMALHQQPALRHLGYARGAFPESEKAAQDVLSLPMYPELSEREVRTVTTYIREFYSRTQKN